MKRRLLTLGAVFVVMLLAVPAVAITNPTDDNGEHPQVGQLLFFVPDEIDPRFGTDDPGAWFNCSGTVIADKIVLTAGHCTFAVGSKGESTNPAHNPSADTDGDGSADNGIGGNDIWFTTQETVDYGFLPPSSTFFCDGCGGNAARYAAWAKALNRNRSWVRGSAHPHDLYNDQAFYLHDAGVVVLAKSAGVKRAQFGRLPALGHLDAYFAQPRDSQRFTPVGYGLQGGFPYYEGGDTRYQASVMLVDQTGVLGLGPGISVLFSNDAGAAHQGGTCFGDSGGPVFDGDTITIVAVTSFGINQTCTGVGGGYRIDQDDDIEFIGEFLP